MIETIKYFRKCILLHVWVKRDQNLNLDIFMEAYDRIEVNKFLRIYIYKLATMINKKDTVLYRDDQLLILSYSNSVIENT